MIADTVEFAHKLRLIMELRRAGIADARTLGAFEKIPRELFVPDEFQDQAYEDVALPIGCGQTISQPYIVALMTEMLEIGERDKVLEIGTGSGYQAAILSRLCRRVFTIERHRALVREAEERFRTVGLGNIISLFADGGKGWPEQAPFDRIIVTAASPQIPATLFDQLAPGGIMVLPVGDEYHDQRLVRLRRGESDYETEELAWVRFVPMLAGLPRPGDTPGIARDSVDFAID